MVSKFHLSFGFFIGRGGAKQFEDGQSALSRRCRFWNVTHKTRRDLPALERSCNDEPDSFLLFLACQAQLHQFSVGENLSYFVVQLVQ